MNAVKITDWRLVFVFDPDDTDHDVIKYVLIAGAVRKHPELCPKGSKEDLRIETSAVETFDGDTLTTAHTRYQLGTPSEEYLTLLKSRRLTWNAKRPVPDCFFPGHEVRVAA